MIKYFVIVGITFLNLNLSRAESSMPDLPYNKDVKVGDCFVPKNKRFPLIMRIEQIKTKEKKYAVKMFFQTQGGEFYEHPMGEVKYNEKSKEWDKTKCPAFKK